MLILAGVVLLIFLINVLVYKIQDDRLEKEQQAARIAAENGEPEEEEEVEEEVNANLANYSINITKSKATDKVYTFANAETRSAQFKEHGDKMGFETSRQYEAAASAVLNNPNVILKRDRTDDHDVYYVIETNEFVEVDDDGYLMTYFLPKSGMSYYENR